MDKERCRRCDDCEVYYTNKSIKKSLFCGCARLGGTPIWKVKSCSKDEENCKIIAKMQRMGLLK